MIPKRFVEGWTQQARWQTLAMVEQDLVISRALVGLYNEPTLQEELVFRGGTALNKLFIHPPARYSEDIDLVQRHPSPIGPTIDRIRAVLEPWLGGPRRKITPQGAKLVYRYQDVDGLPARLKVEINTTEHLQVLPLQRMHFSVDSEWFTGQSEIVTYALEELMGTKLRALYQRRKGRDLFDLWYVCKQGEVDTAQVVHVFQKYCAHEGAVITKALFQENLALKRLNRDFQTDMQVLLPPLIAWDFDTAYDFVEATFISQLP
ncbi:MAG: nucleotidyl transferase AbiEii/AbiGii toxin family protein [Roseivirga sp.]